MAKKTYYFQHDYNSRNDPKIVDLIDKMGPEGYGFYWILIEVLYEQGGTVPMSAAMVYAKFYRMDQEKATSVINDFGLFDIEDQMIRSASIERRLAKTEEIAEKRRMAAANRWNKETEGEDPETPSAPTEPAVPAESAPVDRIDYQKIVADWHQTCPSLSKVRALTDERKAKIRTRFVQMSDPKILEGYGAADAYDLMHLIFARLEGSDFCKGDNKSSWKADFMWIMDSPNNWTKVMEGRYDNRKKGNNNKVNEEWN